MNQNFPVVFPNNFSENFSQRSRVLSRRNNPNKRLCYYYYYIDDYCCTHHRYWETALQLGGGRRIKIPSPFSTARPERPAMFLIFFRANTRAVHTLYYIRHRFISKEKFPWDERLPYKFYIRWTRVYYYHSARDDCAIRVSRKPHKLCVTSRQRLMGYNEA